MLTIRLAGRPLSLLPGTTLQLEINSPLFDEDDVLSGTFTYTFTLPLDAHNRAEFGWPDVLENVADLRRSFDDCAVEDAGFVVGSGGQLRIRRITPTRLDVAVVLALSRVAPDLKERPLSDFEFGGTRTVAAFVPVGLDGGGNPQLVPGLVLHANETVEDFDGYDYVFAPLRNHFSEADPPVVATVNPWAFSDVPLLGLPAGGSFSYVIDFSVPGGVAVPLSPVLYCPFPKLSYVLSSLFQELGVPVYGLGLGEELGRLVVLSAATVASSFRLADVLPGVLSVKELLLRLRSTLGWVPLVGPDGALRGTLRQAVLDDTEYEDWSHLAAPGYAERTVEEVTGHTLVYRLGGGDEVAERFFTPPQLPLPLPVGPAVDTAADLPTPVTADYAQVPAPELRLVLDEQGYYRSEPVYDTVVGAAHTVRWSFYASARFPVPVAGGGEQREQGITATATERVALNPWASYQEDYLVPALEEAPYAPTVAGSERSEQLRLGFYRGRQPMAIDPATHPYAADNPTYPLVTPFATNAQGRRVGEYSLQLDGADGTVARLVGEWAELVATAAPVKWSFYLEPQHLAELNLARKVRVHGNLYLVRQISCSLPLQKAATVTLVPLPRG